ncbi:acyl-CoA carboxylase subunit beta [Dehalococcoidia bacterium]|nr:acyl-CoA carboxylase subunit beta [Dehalococcoidia bacterium]MCL0089036.1 acyl-CoA carboxylase subunit beta [Dehalococcoidia bacterium]
MSEWHEYPGGVYKSTEDLYRELEEKRRRIMQLGDPKILDRRRQAGQLNARERLEYLFDGGDYTEIGMHIRNRTVHFGMDEAWIPAEGVVTAYGKVNGRWVVSFSEDFSAMAGSFGEYHGKKETYAIQFAMERGWPVIGINDSGGARLQEGMDTLESYGWLFRMQDLASGVIPQIALLLGPCLGGQAYHPIMQDFLIQTRETGFMGIAGPAFVKTQIGEDITLQQLSGWRAHAVKSGQTHIVAEDDKDAIDKAKELLAFFPANNREKPPQIKTDDPPERIVEELDDMVPAQPFKPFDMKKVITALVDDGHFVETLELYAKNLITGFARFNGRPVGIVANQPTWAAGILDIDSSDKGARFIRFCDLFNIPLVTLVDCPGFVIGSQSDWAGILRHGAKMLFAWSDATVPLISIILRKSYAGAHYGMLDKSIGADFVFAWPTARVTIVGADTAASVIFAREIRGADNPEETKSKRVREYSEIYENPYVGAERGYIDDIIMPHDTRKYINRALDLLVNKFVTPGTCPWKVWRKYSNINL